MAIFKSYTLNVDTITAKSQNKSFWDSVVKTAYDQIVEYFTNVYKLSGGNLTCRAYQTYKKGVYLSCNFVSSSGTVDIIWKVRTSNGADTYICMSGCSDVTFSHTVPTPSADHGGSTGENIPFEPPQPSNAEKIEDVPFYENLLKNGEIGSFDDLTQPEFDYLQDTVQKGEVGLFDTLINKTKDFFMGSSKDTNVFRDVNISYDGDNPDLIKYYADNGLDTSKSYNINMDGIRVGYKDNGSIHPITTGANISKTGSYIVSKAVKDKFLSNGEIYMAHTQVGSSGGLGTPNIVSNIGTGAVIGLLTSGAIDNIAENTVDGGAEAIKMLGKGITYVVSKGKNMYQDFTSTGDRSKDLFNHAVQSESYTKGITNVVQGGATMSNIGVDLKGQSIPISLPTTGIALTVPTTGVGLNIPTTGVNLNVPTATNIPLGIPTTGVGLNIPSAGVALNVPATGVQLNVTGKQVGIADGGKVQLDIPTDAALPVDGLDENFKAVYANKAGNLGKTDTILVNEIEKHNIEYVTDGGVRGKEKNVADWKDLEYKTTVTENGAEVNKINRDIQAWAGMHSLNPDTSYSGESDTAGNQFNIPKGLIGALAGAGILEYFREGAMSKALLNVKAQAQADQIEKKSEENENDDSDSEGILRGAKKIVYPGEGEYVSQGEGYGSGLKDLQVHSSKMEVK